MRASARMDVQAHVSMQIIIIGGGETGFALAKALAPRHAIFVIDRDSTVGDRFSSLDVEFLTGSGTSDELLRRAKIEAADLFIACTDLDEVNIVSCALARQLGSSESICFVSNDDFLRSENQVNILHTHFNIDRVIWPEAQLAADIERIVAAPGAIDAEVFAEGQIKLLEYRLEPGSPMLANQISELNLPDGAIIAAVKHKDVISIPRGSKQLKPGDKIIVMGTSEAMNEIQKLLRSSDVSDSDQIVTIVGGGDVGFQVAQHLDSLPNVTLRVIERDFHRSEMLASVLNRALVLNGDGTDLELLESEEIGRSDVLISVIDDDGKNLLTSLLGRQLGVRKVITRVSENANLRLFERVGIDVAISARGAAVASIVHQIEGGKSTLLAVLEEGQAQILEVVVPDGYPATPLSDMTAPPDSIVGAIVREGQTIVPRGRDVIRAADHLLIFCTTDSADIVRDYFTSTSR